MSFKTFMQENWLSSILIFVLVSVFSVSLIFFQNLAESSGSGLLLEVLSILLFFVSLFLLGPYLVGVIATESKLVFLGITWNVYVFWSLIVLNVIYVYLFSCALILLYNRIIGK